MFELCVSAINVQIGAAIVKVILTRSSPPKKRQCLLYWLASLSQVLTEFHGGL